jgi:DNA-directed RNA polymerase specialized sigma subunit
MQIDNKQFKQNLVECQSIGKLNQYLTNTFITLVNGVSKKIIVKRLHDLEDLKQSAFEDIFKNWKKYDSTKDNPHAYFSKIAKNSMQLNNKKLYEQHKKIKPEIVSYEEFFDDFPS